MRRGRNLKKKIVSQYYYKSLSRKIIPCFLYMAFLMKCEFCHFITHNTSLSCRETYPPSAWDFLPYWVNVLGLCTLHNVTFLWSLRFGGTCLKMSGYCVCFSEETSLLLVYLIKALEIFFLGNSDDFSICHSFLFYCKFNEYYIHENYL